MPIRNRRRSSGRALTPAIKAHKFKMADMCGNSCRLVFMIVLVASFFVIELIVGHMTNSLALVGDSYHMLSDVIALIIGLVSVNLSKRSWQRSTYGWVRAEVLGAHINAIFLLVLCFTIFLEAIQRLIYFEVIEDPDMLLIVGGIGLAINLIGLGLFAGHGHSHGGHGHSHGGQADQGHSHGDQGHSHGDQGDSHKGHGHTHSSHGHSDESESHGSQCDNESVTSEGHDHGVQGHSHKKPADNHTGHSHSHNTSSPGNNKYPLADPNAGSTVRYTHTGDQSAMYSRSGDITNIGIHGNATKASKQNQVYPEIEAHGYEHDDNYHEDDDISVMSLASQTLGDRLSASFRGKKKKHSDAPAKQINSGSQLNMRAVFLHVLGDAFGSIVVIISALVVKYVEHDCKYYVDPIMSFVIIIIITASTVPLFKETSLILLQALPRHIDVAEMEQKLMKKVEGIEAIHEFHAWQLGGNCIVASVHVRCSMSAREMDISRKVKAILHEEGIHSTTVQQEYNTSTQDTDSDSERDCLFECGPDLNCFEQTCCYFLQKGDIKYPDDAHDNAKFNIQEVNASFLIDELSADEAGGQYPHIQKATLREVDDAIAVVVHPTKSGAQKEENVDEHISQENGCTGASVVDIVSSAEKGENENGSYPNYNVDVQSTCNAALGEYPHDDQLCDDPAGPIHPPDDTLQDQLTNSYLTNVQHESIGMKNEGETDT